MKFCVQWMIGFFCFLLFCVEGFSIESEANQEKLSIEPFKQLHIRLKTKSCTGNFIESNVKINGLFTLKPSI